METPLHNVRFALRSIGSNPWVAVVVVLALALGIGANIAIFTVVNAVLLRPLPYPDSGRLVQIWGRMPSRNIPFHLVPYPDYTVWKEQSHSFESMSAYRQVSMNLTNHGEPLRLSCLRVNADFFPMLRVPPLYGRSFLPEEDKPGGTRVAVMTHSFWQQSFGSDQGIVGQSLTLDGNPYTVVGIMPPEFQFGGQELALYIPLAASGVRSPQNLSWNVGAYARLKSGISMEQAQSDIDALCARLNEEFPAGIPRSARVWGLREFMVRNVQMSLWILMGAAGLVLLIACTNIANILFARAEVRRKEMAIRAALGAGRGRLIRQVLVESIVLSLIGGLAGMLLASWGVGLLTKAGSAAYPLLKDTSLDASVLGFTLLLSLLAGAAFGIAPALRMAREGVSGSLPASLMGAFPGASRNRGRARIRSFLVVVEVALSMMLLISAGLLLRSFARLQRVDPGFDPRGVLTAGITLPQEMYPNGTRRLTLYRQVLENLEHNDEVASAGIVDLLPLGGTNSGMGFYPEGRPSPPPGENPIVWLRSMSEGYFRTMSIPMLSGRQLTEADNPQAPPVAIVNRTLARRYWPDEDAVGKRFTLSPIAPGVSLFTVVGVAGDVRHTNLIQEPDAELFLSFRQMPPARATLVVRARSDPARMPGVMRMALAAADKSLPLARIQPMEQLVADSISSQHLTMMLLGIFAVLALVLATVGMYGVLSYAVTQRRREIGIRMALGAPKMRVFRMVTGNAMLLALIGESAGLGVVFALRKLIGSQLYDATIADPMVMTAVPALLAAIAFLAAAIPARRAMRVDPTIALRVE